MPATYFRIAVVPVRANPSVTALATFVGWYLTFLFVLGHFGSKRLLDAYWTHAVTTAITY